MRSDFLDGLFPALLQDSLRPIRVMNPNGGTFDLATLMQQIVGRPCPDPTERLELCHAALTTLLPDQRRIVLIIDDADLLTDQCLRYLDLMVSVAGSSRAPLQVMLVGGPAIWRNLPPKGALAADNVGCRVTLGDTIPAFERSASPFDGPMAQFSASNSDGSSRSGERPSDAVPVNAVPVDAETVNAETVDAETVDAVPVDAAPEAERHVEDTLNMVAMVRSARAVPAEAPPPPSIFAGFALPASFALVIATGFLVVGVLVYNAVSHGPATQISVAEASVGPAQDGGAADVPALAKLEVTAAADTVSSPPAVVASVANGNGLGPEVPAPIQASQADAGNRPPQPDTVVAVQPRAPATSADAAAPVSPAAVPPSAVSVAGATEGAEKADRPGIIPTTSAGSATLPATAAPAVPPAVPPATSSPVTVAPVTVAPVTVAPAAVTPVAAAIAVPQPPVRAAPDMPRAMAPEVVAVLIARGDELLSTGDVTAARLMYSRAAASASADGAAAMGMTFDPNILPQFGVHGLQADPRQATIWYQRAADLGSPAARKLLDRLQDGTAK